MVTLVSKQPNQDLLKEDIRRQIATYIERAGSFELRRSADLDSIQDRLDAWSTLVEEDTGVTYDTRDEIIKYSNYRHFYTSTNNSIIFPMEILESAVDPSQGLIVMIPGTNNLFAFHNKNMIGLKGHEYPTHFGFFGTVYPGPEGHRSDRYMIYDTGIAVPNEILQWMTPEMRARFENEVNHASHDYAHSQELFIPEGNEPQELKDWQVLMMSSRNVTEHPDITNLEAKAIMESRLVHDRLHRDQPDLKKAAIRNADNFLSLVEKERDNRIKNNPGNAKKHESIAAYLCILYLSHLRPGIDLKDIPNAKKWADFVQRASMSEYDTIENRKFVPWGNRKITPQMISLLHKASMQKLIEHDPVRSPMYKGQSAPDARNSKLSISQEQAQTLLNKYEAVFLGQDKQPGILQAAENNLNSGDALAAVGDLFTGLKLHSSRSNGPTGKPLQAIKQYGAVLGSLKDALNASAMPQKERALRAIVDMKQDIALAEKEYLREKEEKLSAAAKNIKHLEDGLRAIQKKSLLYKVAKSLLANERSDNKTIKYSMWTLMSLLSGETVEPSKNPVTVLRSFVKGMRGIGYMKKMVRAEFQIDHRIDTMPPDKLLNAGETRVGTTLAPFLLNEEVVTPSERALMDKIVLQGGMSPELRNSFANLSAVMIQEGARHALRFLNSSKTEERLRARHDMVEANMRLSEVCYSKASYIFNTSKDFDQYTTKGLTYEDISTSYPVLCGLARVAQWHDDMIDMFQDLSDEISTKRPSPNSVLAKVAENGGLLDDHGEIKPEIKDFVEKYKNDSHRVTLDKFPVEFQNATKEVLSEFRIHTATLPTVLRDVFRGYMDAALKDGCHTQETDRIKKKIDVATRAAEKAVKTGKMAARPA